MEVLPKTHNVRFLDQPDVDFTNPSSLRSIVTSYKPALVINAAAYTAVDNAESDKSVAYLINSEAPSVIASACKQVNSIFIHYSTDYVFSGSGTTPYQETDATSPSTVYGRSKLDGEQAIIAATDRYIILRTAWLYSLVGKNFLKTMLGIAKDRSEICVVSDQIGSPTYAVDLARATSLIVDELSVSSDDKFGVYHAVNSGQTTWHGFASKILTLGGYTDVKVKAIMASEYATPAPRPQFSVLSCEKLNRVFGVALPEWQDAVSRCMVRFVNNC
tara:strand:+ start:4328 stop:5149 length:822 start_codon:yes stop_codon:yes gene_type:complete